VPGRLYVLHQSKPDRLVHGLSAGEAVLALERPSSFDAGAAALHGLDKGQEFRRDLYRGLLAAIGRASADTELTSRLSQLFAPVVFRALDLACTLRLFRALGETGRMPTLHLVTDSYPGFVRLRRLQRQLRAAGLRSELQGPGRMSLRCRVRESSSRRREVAKQFLRKQLLRRRLRLPKPGDQGEALVFHATAARIWEPLLPLIEAAKARPGAAVVAAVSTESVRGTPFGLPWDAVVSLDGSEPQAALRRQRHAELQRFLHEAQLEDAERLLLRGLARELATALDQRLAIEEGVLRLCARYSRVCLVTADGFGITTSSMFGVGNSLPKVTFAMMPHGMFDPRWPEMQYQPQPQFLLCWNEAMLASVRAKSTMTALLVGYHGGAGQPQHAERDRDRVLVAFGRPDTVLDIETFDRAVNAVADAAQAHPGLTFVIRPHPSDRTTYWERRLPAMPGNVVVSSMPPLEDELDEAFVVLTMHSTVGMQAICRGSAVIVVRPANANYADPPDYVTFGAAGLAEDGASLSTQLDALAQTWPSDERAPTRASYASTANSPVDLGKVLDQLLA